MDKKFQKNNDRVFINHYIKVPTVLCIDQNNENLGVIATSKALELAREAGLDLVQVSPPTKEREATCRITNYGKLRYDESKKKKEADRKQREAIVKEKEIKFHPSTQYNDLQYKAKKAEEILAEGDRVRVSIVFRGREASHRDLGLETLNQFLDLIPSGEIISQPNFDGKVLSTVLVRK